MLRGEGETPELLAEELLLAYGRICTSKVTKVELEAKDPHGFTSPQRPNPLILAIQFKIK